MSDPFLGEIRFVGFNFAPRGWATCQGQLMSIAQNSALFSLLGVNFGGNGTQNFGLPDLQGRSPVGVGTGPGLSPIVLGEMAGVESVTLTSAQMPIHNHTATATPGTVSLPVSVAVPVTTTSTGATNTPSNTTILCTATSQGHPATIYNTSAATTTLAPFNATASGSVTPAAPTINVSGGSQPFSVRNPYLGLTAIIALSGIFPTRQ